MNNRDYKRLASRDIGPGGVKCPCCADRNTVRRGHRRVRHRVKTDLACLACRRDQLQTQFSDFEAQAEIGIQPTIFGDVGTPKTPFVRMAAERDGVLVVDVQGTNTPDELMDMVVEDLAAERFAEDEDLTNQAIDDRIEAQLKGGFR
jgi:hypothetical protein